MYNQCFTLLKSAAQDLHLRVLPERVISDFEAGLLQAIDLQFPMARIQGCFYHFAQAIWRKVQNLGLQTTYQDEPDFKTFVSKMVALAFCDQRFIRVVWTGLKDTAPAVDGVDDLVEYFERTWLNGSFPARMWNFFEVDGPRTNNHVEGWHAKMNRLAGKSHPNIFEVVELFKTEQATTEVTLQQLAAGGQPVVRRKQYRLKDQRIKRIKEKQLAGDYSLDEYITSISKWMGFRL